MDSARSLIPKPLQTGIRTVRETEFKGIRRLYAFSEGVHCEMQSQWILDVDDGVAAHGKRDGYGVAKLSQ